MKDFPSGWYTIAFSRDLKPKQILTRKVSGLELILWRTDQGQAVISTAYCPHLGAHLGYGGSIKGDRIQCPFHKFSFDAQGKCRTPLFYHSHRPAEALKVYPSREQNGVVLVFMGSAESLVVWDLPHIDEQDYMMPLVHSYVITAHPQDIAENSVDLLHFKTVHHYEGARLVSPIEAQGAYLKAHYRIFRRGISFLTKERFEVTFIAHLWGLGFSYVDVQVPSLKIEARAFIWATPLDRDKLELRIGFSMKEISNSKSHPWFFQILPKALLNRILQKALFLGFKGDVSQDIPIFSRKIRIDDPALSEADGPIRLYRQWAQQFYEV